MDFDANRKSKIVREQKKQREGKKIDYRDMNAWDDDEFYEDAKSNKRSQYKKY